MVAALLDTSILVDILRGHAPAGVWIQAQTRSTYGIVPPVWMEVISGAANKTAQLGARTLLLQFEMIYLTQEDQEWAMQQQLAYQLSHGVGVWDCLIASVSHRLNVPLFTANLRHFAPLLGALAQKPY